jgi:hypothetical protein
MDNSADYWWYEHSYERDLQGQVQSPKIPYVQLFQPKTPKLIWQGPWDRSTEYTSSHVSYNNSSSFGLHGLEQDVMLKNIFTQPQLKYIAQKWTQAYLDNLIGALPLNSK